jgi:outer membrane receptor protein involved in Fe transport
MHRPSFDPILISVTREKKTMGTRDKLAGAHAHISLKTAIRLALLAGASASCFAPPAAADANDGSVGLDEIVVTATRRDTSILDVPYSISAISSTQLEADHVQTLSDLSKLIAGVSFVDEGPASRSNFVLRGINANGTDHPSTSTVAPVSTYIGETPLFVALQIDDIDARSARDALRVRLARRHHPFHPHESRSEPLFREH